MNMLPAESEQFATAHSCLNCQNDKLLQQRRSSPLTCGEQALFFPIFEAAFAPLWDARASNHFHGIAREPITPLPKRGLDGVAQRVEFAHDCRRGSILKSLITIGRDICACEL